MVGGQRAAVPVDKANLNLGEAGLLEDHLRAPRRVGSHPWALEPRKNSFYLAPSALRSTTPSDWSSCCLAGRRKPDLLPPLAAIPGRGLEAQHINNPVWGLIHSPVFPYKGDDLLCLEGERK